MHATTIHRAAAEPKSAGRREQHRQRPQINNHGNISELLDNLLRGYDNSVRPDFGGPPATVEVDIMVRSMGPISEVDMVREREHFASHIAARDLSDAFSMTKERDACV